jgi:eukaryotic-like serine/threonine-protein kinase
MELVQGVTMRSKMNKTWIIHPKQMADWLDQILEGIKAAHQAGIIHRDLKPENILLVEQPEDQTIIKILDFGLAKIRHYDPNSQTSLTSPGAIMGSFGYMSPEQIRGEAVDERTDIFAIGVIMIEALTGHRPFVGKTATDIMDATLHDAYHLDGVTDEVRHFDELIQKCIAKGRDKRFRSISEMQAFIIPELRKTKLFAASTTPTGKSSNVITKYTNETK